jgi:hypothetical protein
VFEVSLAKMMAAPTLQMGAAMPGGLRAEEEKGGEEKGTSEKKKGHRK